MKILLFLFISAISAYQIWQVTDVHYDANYKPNTDPAKMCREGTGSAKPLGDYGCDTTIHVMKSIPPFIKSHSTDKNHNKILLYNGDIIPRKVHDYEFDYLAEGLDNATAFLEQFADFEIIPMLGNHDAIPENYLDETSTNVYEYAANKWKKWLPVSAQQTFRKGGYYTKKIRNTANENKLNKLNNNKNNKNKNSYDDEEEAYVLFI